MINQNFKKDIMTEMAETGFYISHPCLVRNLKLCVMKETAEVI